MKTLAYYFLFLLNMAALGAAAQTPLMSSYPAAKATAYLDFDGQLVTGTVWNYIGDIAAAASGLSSTAITEIVNRVAEDFRPFNFNVTTDSTAYWAAPANMRIRIIVTPTSQWYGAAGGVSYVGSFTWGDNTPAWVFSALLGNKPKWVAEAISHEIGHTLGLQHQSVYDNNCKKTAEYNTGQGTGEIGWAPIMGAGYYQNHTTWNIGPNTVNCSTIQNDLTVITTGNGFGLRPDDHGNTIATATLIPVAGNNFSASGLINSLTDLDVFRLEVPYTTVLNLNAIPQNVGSGDDGANIDIKISLMNGTDTINSYNPSTLLNAGIDTNLNAGIYYLVISGVGNMYHDNVGSLGWYNISGSFASLLATNILDFRGMVNSNDSHQLSWSLQQAEDIRQVAVEISADGMHFSTLALLSPSVHSYTWQPPGNEPLYYRLKLSSVSGTSLSPVISLKSKAGNKIHVLHNGSRLTISSSGSFNYQLYTMGGSLVAAGRLNTGMNPLPQIAAKGLLLLHCSNGNQAFTQKIINQ